MEAGGWCLGEKSVLKQKIGFENGRLIQRLMDDKMKEHKGVTDDFNL